MQTYRVEVGRRDNVGPGNIVGAVTNEADLSNADIGRIKIYDRYSTIDLPANLPIDILNHLAGVFVSGRALEISKSDQPSHGSDRGRSGGGGRGRYQSGGRGGRGDRNGRGERGGRGREGGFNRGGDRSRRESSNDRPARREGGFSRGSGRQEARSERGGRNERPARREGGFNRGGSDRPARRESGGGYTERSPRRESTSGSDRKDTRVYSTSKPGKTKAAQRAKAKRRPDAKASSPVKKYVKIRAKKK